MSEKIETKSRTVIDTIHHFYCDSCGKYLGYDTESSDGYYEIKHELDFDVFVPFLGRRYFRKCLCDDCTMVLIQTLDNALEHLGFSNKAYEEE